MTAASPAAHPIGTVPGKSRSAVFWSSLSGLASVGLPFAVFTCFARLMTPQQFALVGLALAGLEMLKTLSPQGLYDVLVTHDEAEADYHQAAAAILLGSAVIVMAAFCVLLSLSQAVFGMRMPGVIYALTVKVLFDLALLQPQAVMVRRNHIRRLSMRSMFSGGIGALCGLPLGIWVSPVGGLVAFYVIQSLVTFLATVWGSTVLAMPRYHAVAAREMMGQAMRASGVRVAAGGNNYLDQLMIGRLFLPDLVGQFNLGKRIEIVSVTIASSLAQIVWQPGFAMTGVQDRCSAIARGVASVALVCGLPVCLFAALSPAAVPFVFGQHWATAAPVAAVLALSGGMRALGGVAGAVLTVTQRNGFLLWVSVGGLVTNVITIVIMAPYGIFPTALAVLARTTVQSLIQYVMLIEVRDKMAKAVLANFVVPLVLATAACWVGGQAASHALSGLSGRLHDFLYLCIGCATGLIVGVPLLLRRM